MTTDGFGAGDREPADDYDLLTYSEAVARLVELIKTERVALEALQTQASPDAAAVRTLSERIALLETSAARYRQAATTAEVFTERFGAIPRTDEGRGTAVEDQT